MKNKKFRVLALALFILVIISGCVSQNNGSNADNNPPIVEDTVDIGGNDTESPANNGNEDTGEQGLLEEQNQQTEVPIDEDGTYTDPYLVAEYIHKYNKLPPNYITKNEARKLGWESDKGNLWEVTDEMSIGGDIFGNREGLLPKKEGRIYYECDVNYTGGYRGSERIIYSDDGLIFYTDDHYESFTQLY
jgi:ribonuclease T1